MRITEIIARLTNKHMNDNELLVFIIEQWGAISAFVRKEDIEKVSKLEKQNKAALEALKTMCDWHESQATWDKGNNGYYAAKRLLNQSRDEEN